MLSVLLMESGVAKDPCRAEALSRHKIGHIKCAEPADALYGCITWQLSVFPVEVGQFGADSVVEFHIPLSITDTAMLDNEILNRLSRQLSALMPMAEELRDDLRTRIEQQLRASLASFDLLSRTEFDAQAQSLRRAQERVQELEQLLATLDARLTELEAKSGNTT